MTKRHISAALIGLFALTGAATQVKAEEPFFVEVETAPPAIETSPHTVYEGHPAYYVDGHWYYRHGSRWAYYRDEPRPLVEFRSRPARYHREPRVVHERRVVEARPARRVEHERRDERRDERRHDR